MKKQEKGIFISWVILIVFYFVSLGILYIVIVGSVRVIFVYRFEESNRNTKIDKNTKQGFKEEKKKDIERKKWRENKYV